MPKDNDNSRQEFDMPDLCRPFADTSPIPMAAVEGSSYNVRYVNPAFCLLVGKSREELIGNSFSGVVPADAECLALLDRVYGTGQAEAHIGQEHSVIHPFYWSYAMWPVPVAGGRSRGVIIQVTETTPSHEHAVAMNQALMLGALRQDELMEATETLNVRLQEEITQRERSEGRLRALLESASEGIIAVDELGTILLVNAMSEKLFGYSREELLGQPIEILVADDIRGIHRGHRQTYLAHPRTRPMGAGMSLAGRRKDGTLFPVEISLSFVREGGSQVVLALIDDITERKRVDDQLRETAKLESLGVLAGGIAHDFNNILTGVLGNASLVMEQLPANSSIRELIVEVMRSAEQAAQLTNQLLAYSGKGKFIVQPVNLSQFTRDIVTLVRSFIPRTVELDLQLADEVPPIEADMAQLQQLVMNLVINAGEAIGDAPGVVTIRTGVRELAEGRIRASPRDSGIIPGGYVFLEVRDTGSGMDEITRQRIFDPFFTTKFTGRGLGLSAVLGIVRGHLGAIDVESSPGRGSTFTVMLPGTTLHRTPEPTHKPAAAPGSGTVLIVDDEEAIRKLARIMLEHAGYKVIVAENGKEAIRIFREAASQIAVVLLDMTMPLMSGAETLKHLRDLNSDVPIALSSGFSELEALARFPVNTVEAFVQKPYTNAHLVEQINRILVDARKPQHRQG
jgi:PAS domain S-box-containing protein